MRSLERNAGLDRVIQGLPDDEEIQRRQSIHRGLTRPELSVLLSYSKMWLYEELLASDLPDEALLEADLDRYFPKPLQKILWKTDSGTPTAPGDHRDLHHQFYGEPGRQHFC